MRVMLERKEVTSSLLYHNTCSEGGQASPAKVLGTSIRKCDADLVVESRTAALLYRNTQQTAQHGYPRTPIKRHSSCPADQHHQPARKLLLQILHVPCHELAATQLRRRRCVSPLRLNTYSSTPQEERIDCSYMSPFFPGIAPAKDTLRPTQDRRLRSRKDGRGAQ